MHCKKNRLTIVPFRCGFDFYYRCEAQRLIPLQHQLIVSLHLSNLLVSEVCDPSQL